MHFERKVTHEQARDALRKFTNQHFHKPVPHSEMPRASIPAQPSDTDLLLSDYISQQEQLEDDLREGIAKAQATVSNLLVEIKGALPCS